MTETQSDWLKKLPRERITQRAFDGLPEYSMSNPTGTVIGKVWKCNMNVFRTDGPDPLWVICEYIDIGDPKNVGIYYRIPVIGETMTWTTARMDTLTRCYRLYSMPSFRRYNRRLDRAIAYLNRREMRSLASDCYDRECMETMVKYGWPNTRGGQNDHTQKNNGSDP